MPDSDARRVEVHFSGRVQGVGFRYTARSLAGSFDVLGYVRNLPDGRVLLVAEGASAELDRFLQQIEDRLGHYIGDTQVQRGEATGEFRRFEIRQ